MWMKTMRVRVRVFGDLAKALGKDLTVDLPLGSTVGDLLDKIGEGHVRVAEGVLAGGGRGANMVVLLGGLNVQFLSKFETILNEGDVVSLLPPAGGG